MAIGADSAVDFFGTQDSLDSSSASVADAAFSVVGDLIAWVNDDDAPQASVVLEATFSVAPDANSSVALFAQLNDVQSTIYNGFCDRFFTGNHYMVHELCQCHVTKFRIW
jgi:hypothetical protein